MEPFVFILLLKSFCFRPTAAAADISLFPLPHFCFVVLLLWWQMKWTMKIKHQPHSHRALLFQSRYLILLTLTVIWLCANITCSPTSRVFRPHLSVYLQQVRLRTSPSYLTISEHGGIVAFKATLDELVHAGLVDALLFWVHIKHKVIGEGFVLSQEDLWFSRCDQCAHVAALDLLLGHLRTNPERREEKERQSANG